MTVALVALPDGRRAIVRQVAILAAIVLLFLAPYIIYTSVYDGFWRHIVRGIELQAVESGRGRSIPAFTVGAEMLASNAVPWLFFLFHLLPIVAVVIMWVRWRQQRDVREIAMVVPLTLVAALVNAGLIRDTLSARLPDAVVPAALILGWMSAGASACVRRHAPASCG